MQIKNKLVIEGPNNVGKSTLIEKIKEETGYSSIHLTAESDNSYNSYLDLITGEEPLIMDRSMISEYIYSVLFGREPKLTKKELIKLLQTLQLQKGRVLIILPKKVSELEKNYKSKGEEFDEEFAIEEFKAYVNLIKELHNDSFNLHNIYVVYMDDITTKEELYEYL